MSRVHGPHDILYNGQTHDISEDDAIDLILGDTKSTGFWNHLGE